MQLEEVNRPYIDQNGVPEPNNGTNCDLGRVASPKYDELEERKARKREIEEMLSSPMLKYFYGELTKKSSRKAMDRALNKGKLAEVVYRLI